jgi:uncharacterized membrane protein
MTAIVDVDVTREMEASTEQLWSVLNDLRRLPEWLEFAAELEEVSGSEATRGAFYTVKPRGRFEPKTHWRIAAVEPPHRQVHESDMPVMRDVTSMIEIRPGENGGVQAHVHWKGVPSNLTGRLMRPMFQRRITQNWERSLEKLDELALSSPAT